MAEIKSSADIAKEFGISENEVRARRTALLRARWKTDFEMFCRQRFVIRDKQGVFRPLELNDAQKELVRIADKQIAEEGWSRIIGCKGRRQGFSTVSEARGYWRATLWNGYNVYVQAHMDKSSEQLFEMVKTAWSKDPMREQTSVNNARSLKFDRNGSKYTVATAGSKGGGRGGAVSFLHASEAAWYKDAISNLAAAVQSVDEVRGVWGVLWKEPSEPLPFERGIGVIEGWIIPPSEIWIESTSAGNSGIFYDMYMDAMNGIGRYRHVFISWTLQPEYSVDNVGDWVCSEDIEMYGDGNEISEREYMELNGLTIGQMRWRHEKITELRSLEKFMQEFPLSVEEAFSSGNVEDRIIKPSVVLRARKRKPVVIDAPIIMGVDPSSGNGNDRYGVVVRQGQQILYWSGRNDLDVLEASDDVVRVAQKYKPELIVIDNGNLGNAVISYINRVAPKMSEKVHPFNFGGTSQLKLYAPQKAGAINRRAEIYERLSSWLNEGGCLPDNDIFCSEVACNIKKWRTNNDWLLLSKTELKKQGIRSPDIADALAMTFAQKNFEGNGVSRPSMAEHSNRGDLGLVKNYEPDYTDERYGGYGWQV